MLRALIAGLAILHLGPGIAFAILAFGCDGGSPAPGPICAARGIGPFAMLTVALWLLLGLGLLAWRSVDRARRHPSSPAGLRLMALAAVLALGGTIAGTGHWLLPHPGWALAVPACLAAAWLALANPARCVGEDSGG